MSEFRKDQLIVYTNGDRFEIGRIKRIEDDGAFVCYHGGETASKTPFERMHPLTNEHCITETSLGGKHMRQVDDRLPPHYAEIEYADFDNAEAINGARFDDMNFRHLTER